MARGELPVILSAMRGLYKAAAIRSLRQGIRPVRQSPELPPQRVVSLLAPPRAPIKGDVQRRPASHREATAAPPQPNAPRRCETDNFHALLAGWDLKGELEGTPVGCQCDWSRPWPAIRSNSGESGPNSTGVGPISAD